MSNFVVTMKIPSKQIAILDSLTEKQLVMVTFDKAENTKTFNLSQEKKNLKQWLYRNFFN